MLAHHRLLLLRQGVPEAAIAYGEKAKLDWFTILVTFLEKGLPVLLALLQSLLNPTPPATAA